GRIHRGVTRERPGGCRLMAMKRPRTWAALGTWMAAAGLVGALAFLAMPPGLEAFTTRVGQPAPEITGGPWINSEPLSMEKLRGRVVAVEFWTFG
ncbi:MAG: hypothetical protein Q8P98_01285, partial [Candidatus Rokubacteria bacterium]|nr:hypothetical protein [Candidatus Rokubacteria bacterium]